MAFCKYMKMITLPKLRDCLRDLSGEVKVPEEIAVRARDPDRAHGRDRLGASLARWSSCSGGPPGWLPHAASGPTLRG